MTIMKHSPSSDWSRRGLTLLELLVTLVLSVLVLGMVLPLLHQLTQPSSHLDLPEAPAWQKSLQADLSELVSPEKSSIRVFQVLPASGSQPYPQIVLETFCRAGDARGGAASRGPSEVRYVLESDSADGSLVLVRYAKGWHDLAASRHVLADHATDWSVTYDGMPTSGENQADGPSSDSFITGKLLRVNVTSRGVPRSALLWMPRQATRPVPSTQSAGGVDSANASEKQP